MIRGVDAQVPRHVRSQTFAAELTSDQAAVFDLCRAGATWFYNEACASQLDRYRHGVGIESNMSLSYAVSAARKAGVEFPYRGTMRPSAMSRRRCCTARCGSCRRRGPGI
jgi:hypothetical protein